MTSRTLTRLIACCSACFLLPAARADAPAQEVEWRWEYAKARQEALDKNRPLVIDVGTENCFWCKQLDLRTFKDPALVGLLNDRCIPLKVDANRQSTLAEALHVQQYPTLVFASPDGKILGYQEGFIEASPLQEKIQRAIASHGAPPEWMTRDFQEATRAVGGSDFARAVGLLKNIVEDGKDLPVQNQARKMLQELELQAAGRCTRARDLMDRGKLPEAVELVVETVRLYAGTKAARDAGQLLLTLAGRRSEGEAGRTQAARTLLAQARADYEDKQFLRCLDRCETLAAQFADLPEAAEAGKLAAEIKEDPELTRQACDQMGERLGVLYLTMAEGWLKKGQPQQAVFYLERVVQTLPNSRHAELAQVRLAQIQGAPPRTAEVKK
jgi:thioredoxin-like negative regulator of GroEL